MAGNKDVCWVRPEDMNKFYVYALYDSTGWPFYIGKGKGLRINNHTKPTMLKDKSYKNHKIKRLLSEQGFLKREILAYCDSEESALLLERDLISSYGVYTEGGLLCNHSKSHWDLPEKAFVERTKSVKVSRQTKVTDEQIIQAYKMWKDEFVSILSLSNSLGLSSGYLGKIFEGKKRKDLNLTKDKSINVTLKGGLTKDVVESLAYDKFVNGLSYSKLMIKYDKPKTTVARIVKLEGQYAFLRDCPWWVDLNLTSNTENT